jgi:hypothetical protein
MRAGSRALVTSGGEAGVSWTLLAAEVRQGSWKQQLRGEEVQAGHPPVRGVQGGALWKRDFALVVDVWLHRVDEDDSGLTFEEWDPSADTDASEAPVAIIVNSSELRAAGFDLREVIPLQLEAAARGGQRTRGTVLKQIHDMGTRRYVLSVDNDNEFRSRCE